MLNLSNGNTNCPLSVIVLLLTKHPVKSTFDKAISVLQLASTSWTETSKYNWSTYETQPVVAAFTELESEMKDRYTMFKVRLALPGSNTMRY
jgi:hypothetical protein